ncbi:MAG TPA: outer membrane lipoprotein carrier protein LolA [Candidatus Omnitrophica bacterium]|nr:outer membrane lipoprotein carrier protein LolA [Candidatus Omnitrophota bacterium]
MKKVTALLAVGLLLVGLHVTAEDDELAKVLNDIQNKIKNLKSYQAKIEMVFLQTERGIMELTGEIKFVRPDKLRMEIGVKGEDRTKQYMYSDGLTMWQYMPFFKLASKVDLAALKKEFPQAKDLVEGQSKVESPVADVQKENIKYLGIKDLDGEKVYVFEGQLSEDRKQNMDLPQSVSQVKIWVGVNDGLQRKAEYYDSDGNLVFYQVLKDVKVNIDIPASEFTFKQPEGINVLDSTDQARQILKKKQKDEESAVR